MQNQAKTMIQALERCKKILDLLLEAGEEFTEISFFVDHNIAKPLPKGRKAGESFGIFVGIPVQTIALECGLDVEYYVQASDGDRFILAPDDRLALL